MFNQDRDSFPAPRENYNRSFEHILEARLSRRSFIQATCIAGIYTSPAKAFSKGADSTLSFSEIQHGLDERLHIPENYSAQIVVRWGDSLFSKQ